MNIRMTPLSTPYRSGRFAISGQSSESAHSLVLSLRDESIGNQVALGEAVPSDRVLGMDDTVIFARVIHGAPHVENQKIDPERDPPAVPIQTQSPLIKHDQNGVFPAGPAACAFDGALLDAWARSREEPLWKALKLPRPGIATSATVSLGTAAQMADEATALLDAGFTHLKIKLGGTPEEDQERLKAVRSAAPRARLRIDANEGWDLKSGIHMVATLADVGVELLEQPLPRDASLADHHALNKRLEEHEIPHVLDEAVHTAADVKRIAAHRMAHGVNLKLQKTGGLRPALDAMAAAREADLRVMVGCFIETWAGISLALQMTGAVDWADLDGAWLLAKEPVIPENPLLQEGTLVATKAPGLGIAAAAGVLSE